MKAVLVVDIPNGYGDVYDNKAVVTLRNGKLGTSLGIYNVPLKPVPERQNIEYDSDGIPVDERDATYCNGRNDCLDEILGETE